MKVPSIKPMFIEIPVSDKNTDKHYVSLNNIAGLTRGKSGWHLECLHDGGVYSNLRGAYNIDDDTAKKILDYCV